MVPKDGVEDSTKAPEVIHWACPSTMLLLAPRKGLTLRDEIDAVFAFAGAAGVVAGVDGVGLAAVEGDE